MEDGYSFQKWSLAPSIGSSVICSPMLHFMESSVLTAVLHQEPQRWPSTRVAVQDIEDAFNLDAQVHRQVKG